MYLHASVNLKLSCTIHTYMILRFVGSICSLHIDSDLHSQIQVIDNRALPIILKQSSSDSKYHAQIAVALK